MTIFEEKYQKLNNAQKEAVDTIEGPVMVVAGPGTGKTTIITLRIANILLKTDTPASAILAITFTESGVKSLKDKLREIIGERAFEVKIHTFHGLAASVIAEFGEHFTHIHNFSQITDIETETLIRSILEHKDLTILRPFGDPDYYIPQIIRTISESKREALSPEMIESFATSEIERIKNDEESISTRGKTKGELKATAQKEIEKLEKTILFTKVYKQYEELKKQKKFLDYDDLIFEFLLALGRDELLKKLLQEKFLYLHIDEHQDTNDSQNLIMKILSDFFDSPNICIVGDEKQAIYRFQGASVENFLTFKKAWQDIKLIKLADNYRSHQSILDASFSMIENNYDDNEHEELRVKLKSSNGTKASPIDIIDSPSLKAGELYMVEEIKSLLDKTDGEVAVIARNNKDVDKLITVFEGQGIAISADRAIDIYTHPVGILFFSLINFIYDQTNIQALGETLAMGLWKTPFEKKITLLQNLRKGKVAEVLAEIKMLEEIEKEIKMDSPVIFIHKLAELSGFLEVISREVVYVEVWRAILELVLHIARENKNQDIRSLLAKILEYRDSSRRGQVLIGVGKKDNRVKIMTAHKSKGLEFDYVFIPYAIEEAWSLRKKSGSFILPIQVKASEEDSIRDARRLFYVALTRAKKHIILIVPQTNGDKEFTELRFVGELDPAHTKRKLIEDVSVDLIIESPHRVSSNQRIVDLTKETVREKGLSVTALNHFLACPSRFVIKSILKLPEMPNATSEKGNAMHLAMAEAARSEDKSMKNLEKVMIEGVEKYFENSLLYEFEKLALKKELFKNIPNIVKSLHGHLNQDGVMKVEQGFEANYNVIIHGRLDLVVEKENSIYVYDYKTRTKMSINEIKGDSGYFRQLVFYKLLLQGRDSYKGKSIIPSLIFLVPDKSGDCHVESLPIEQSDIEALKKEIDQLLQVVDSGSILDLSCGESDCVYCEMKKLI